MNYECLIVEDEEVLAENTCRYLNLSGVNSYAVNSIKEYNEFSQENSAEVILLDINLGDGNGYTLCQNIREHSQVPIIFISSQTQDEAIILGLNIGADDFVCKPYSLQILLAKVKAALRRSPKKEDGKEIIFGDCFINLNTEKVYKSEKEVTLRGMERKLLMYLISNRNKLITKEELFKNVWEEAFVADGTLNVHIRKLREKIENDPSNPQYIITEYSRGYKFKLEE